MGRHGPGVRVGTQGVRRPGMGERFPPLDAGTLCPMDAPLATPAPTGAGEDPMPATVPTGEDTSTVVGEPATEDPAVSAGPSQVAE